MPEWCECSVSATGSPDQVQRLREFVGGGQSLLTTISPTPDPTQATDAWVDQHWGTRILTNVIVHVQPDDLDPPTRFSMQFDTAWSPPIPAMDRLATKLFPTLSMELHYSCPSLDVGGMVRWLDGVMVESVEGDATVFCALCGADDTAVDTRDLLGEAWCPECVGWAPELGCDLEIRIDSHDQGLLDSIAEKYRESTLVSLTGRTPQQLVEDAVQVLAEQEGEDNPLANRIPDTVAAPIATTPAVTVVRSSDTTLLLRVRTLWGAVDTEWWEDTAADWEDDATVAIQEV